MSTFQPREIVILTPTRWRVFQFRIRVAAYFVGLSVCFLGVAILRPLVILTGDPAFLLTSIAVIYPLLGGLMFLLGNPGEYRIDLESITRRDGWGRTRCLRWTKVEQIRWTEKYVVLKGPRYHIFYLGHGLSASIATSGIGRSAMPEN